MNADVDLGAVSMILVLKSRDRSIQDHDDMSHTVKYLLAFAQQLNPPQLPYKK